MSLRTTTDERQTLGRVYDSLKQTKWFDGAESRDGEIEIFCRTVPQNPKPLEALANRLGTHFRYTLVHATD